MKKDKKQKFNPAWPFPQYDKNGNRLLPPRKPAKDRFPSDMPAAPF